MRRVLQIATVLMVVALLAAGCQTQQTIQPTASTGPKPGGTLRVAMPGNPSSLDPHVGTSGLDHNYLYSIYDTIVAFDAKLNPVPCLAESWSTPDPTTFVFKLRQGVKFHDGTAFNAAAVKANFDRILNPETKAIVFGDLSVIKAVTPVDDYTVKFELKQTVASFLSLLADRGGMVVSPAALEKYGKDIGRNPVGTGAFSLGEWVQDDHITLKKNAAYWEKDRPYVDQIVFKIVPDEAIRLTSMRAGEFDLVHSIPAQDIARMRESKDFVLVEVPSLGFAFMTMNQGKPPFDNKAVRQAISWAIDREAIVKNVTFGAGSAAVGPLPPTSWAFNAKVKDVSYTPRNVAKAKSLLVEAGYPNGFKFNLELANNGPAHEMQRAQAIQAQLAEVGIQVTLAPADGVRVLQRALAGEVDAMTTSWSGRADPDGSLYPLFHSKGSYNQARMVTPGVDELIDKARATYDTEQRKSLYADIQVKVMENAAMILTDYSSVMFLLTPRVKGLEAYGDGKLRLKTIYLGG